MMTLDIFTTVGIAIIGTVMFVLLTAMPLYLASTSDWWHNYIYGTDDCSSWSDIKTQQACQHYNETRQFGFRVFMALGISFGPIVYGGVWLTDRHYSIRRNDLK